MSDPKAPIEREKAFRPRMGKARERVAEASLHVGRLVRSGHGRSFGERRRVSVPRATYGFAPKGSARRVVIKAHVQYHSRHGAQTAARHLRYIERGGVERDGSPGKLYGPDGEVTHQRCEEPRLGERYQFRFTVSPEDGAALDLTEFARSLMEKVERDLGRRIEWAAVNHYDTDHPHVHIVVRGVDLEGRELRMEPAYISRGMRWSAQELATHRLGPRLEFEIQRTYEREVTKERRTSLDRELERLAADQGGGRVDAEAFERRRGYPHPETLARRLQQLEPLGLATRDPERGRGAWVLREGWLAELQLLGERGDRLKNLHRSMTGLEPAHFHVVMPGQPIRDGRGGIEEKPLVARIVRMGLGDETKGTYYAVLETPPGAVYHVPVSGPLVDRLREGRLVTFTAKRSEYAERAIDRHLATEARARGGVYDVGAGGGTEADRKAALGRLEQLERLGLARADAEGQGRWRVAPELLGELERRHSEAPRYRLSVTPMGQSLGDQVVRRGPVWLDQVDAATLSDRGFGADVRAALDRRGQGVLRELGIAPDDPERAAKVREHDRRAVGREVAARNGETFVERLPERFHGHVQPAGERAPYLVVTNGRELVLVDATAERRAWAGRDVVLTRGRGGALVFEDAAEVERARLELGDRIARATGKVFMRAELPDGLRARVAAGPEGYVTLEDGQWRFALAHATATTRRLVGQEVEVARDASGRRTLRAYDRERDRGLER